MKRINLETEVRVYNELKKYSYPRFFLGREYAGTVNSPFQLLHYLLKDGIVQIEMDDQVHEWTWTDRPELKIIEARTNEIIEVRCFD